MEQLKEIGKVSNDKEKSLFDKDKIQEAIDYILEHYEIKKPIQDTAKMVIVCKDENRYAYPPTLDDLFIDLYRANINISENMLYKVLNSHQYIAPYNPIEEYFDSIRSKYKGESHIDLLCKHITPRTWDDKGDEYYQERMTKLIRKWMVACVACWLGKGTREEANDVSLGIIAAEGGLGKSHLMNFIVPQAVSSFFVMASSENGKFDMEDAFTRYMWVYFDELDGLSRRNVETFKKAVSAGEISTKQARERYETDKKRIGCAMFTSNKNQEQGGFMTSEYTPRRFGIIEIEGIDRAYSKLVDQDQLWSEALMLYEETEFNWKFGKADYDEFDEYNHRYVKESPAMNFLQMYLGHPADNEVGEMLSTTEIFDRLQRHIRAEDRNRITINSIGEAMRALGFERKSFKAAGGKVPKGYCVKFKDMDSVVAEAPPVFKVNGYNKEKE